MHMIDTINYIRFEMAYPSYSEVCSLYNISIFTVEFEPALPDPEVLGAVDWQLLRPVVACIIFV